MFLASVLRGRSSFLSVGVVDIMLCDFYSCSKSVREEDLSLVTGLKYCEDHGAQIDEIISRMENDDDAIKEFLGFWVKSYGGAKRLANIS